MRLVGYLHAPSIGNMLGIFPRRRRFRVSLGCRILDDEKLRTTTFSIKINIAEENVTDIYQYYKNSGKLWNIVC